MSESPPAVPVDPAEPEITTLIRRLTEAEVALREHLTTDPDPILDPDSQARLLHSAQKRLADSEAVRRELLETQSAVLDALPAHVALLDPSGVVVAVNAAWRRFARNNGLPSTGHGIGTSYLEVCERAEGPCAVEARAAAAGIRRVLTGELADFDLEYPCHSPAEERWFRMVVTPLRADRRAGAVVMHLDITERKLADSALRESEERFRSTFEQAAVGIAHVSPDGRFLRVNDKLCEITGYPRSELLQLAFWELNPGEELLAEHEARLDMLEGRREHFAIEKSSRRKDGTSIWLKLVTTLQWSADGTPVYFIAVAEDITERKEAEFRLQRLNRLYAVLSRVGEAIVRAPHLQALYDATCRILVAEGGLPLAVVSGLTPDARTIRVLAAHGDHADELGRIQVPYTDSPDSRGTIGTSLRTGRHDVCNDVLGDTRMAPWWKLARQTGIRSSASFPLLNGGRAVGTLTLLASEAGFFQADEIGLMVTVAQDLSFAVESLEREEQRRQAESALRASEATMAAAQRIAHFGSWEVLFPDPLSRDPATLRWSDEMYRIAGYEPGEVGLNEEFFVSLLHPDDREAVLTAYTRAVEGQAPYAIAHRLIRRDGEERIVQATAQVFYEAGTGRPLRMVGTSHDVTEQRRAEARTRELAQRLSLTLESMTDAFFTVDRQWRFTFLNSEAERRLQRSREVLLGQDLWATYPALAGTAFETAYRRAVEQNEAVHLEEYFGLLDMWVEVRAYPSDQGLAVYFRDVSDQHRARQALQVSEERFRLLAQASTDAIWDWDMATDALWWNEGFEALSGFRVGEAASDIHAWGEMIHPGDRQRILDDLQATLDAGGSAWSGEYRFRHKDGHFVYVLDRGKVIRNDAGQPLRMIGGVTDLTERRRMEEELRQSAERLRVSEAQYRLLFAGNPQPMWVYDAETLRILAVNDAALRHYGFTEEEFLARTIFDFRLPGDQTGREQYLQRIRRGGKWSIHRRHAKKDGTLIDVEVTSDEIQFAGRPARLVLANDITERLRHEREAARARRALEMLSRSNEALIRAENETMLLSAICQIAVDTGGFRMAWVGYALEDAARTVLPQAHAGVEEGYLSGITFSWAASGPTAIGPVSEAIRSGQPVVVPDLAVTPNNPYLEKARARGYQGVVCLPLKGPGRTLGVLCLYLPEPRPLLPDELRLLQELADNLAFGIVTLRERVERRRTQEAVLTMARGVSAVTGREFFNQLTLSLVKTVGAYGGFVARLDSPELRTAQTLAAVAAGQIAPNFQYQLHNEDFGDPGSPTDWVVPRDAWRHYPDSKPLVQMGIEAYVGTKLLDPAGNPIGLMVVLFQEPLVERDFVVSTLQIFAVRAAAELERLKADAKVREQAALLDKAQDAILVRGLDHRIAFWNKSAERLYGWTTEEAVGRSARELIYRDPSVFDAAMEKLLAAGDWIGELEQVNREGQTLTIEGRWTLVRDDAGQPVSVLAINTDITERKRLEQQFLRVQRMESIGTLAGGIAHDFNNVLAPIMMAVELLKREEKDKDRLELLAMLESSANRGADMVKQVLSFARGVEGRRVEVQLRHLVREIAKIANDTFLKSIDVRTVMPADLWPVSGDPTQLHQVLLNLCVNARDAMPNGGTLLVSAENVVLDEYYARLNAEARAGRYVRIQVQDTGTGMTREVLDKIFEPFFTTKDHGKGTGLGLPTSLAIVRSHGGFIHVYSEPGAGTTFHVYLPAQVGEGAGSADDSGSRSALPLGHGELVLVVDDEPAVREVTRQTLEAFGYRVLTATDGADAVAQFTARRTEVALVLTDMMMPVMDGPTAIRTIRQIVPGVPIIAASGLNANAMLDSASRAGVSHYLAKPYTAETLLHAVRDALRKGGGAS